MIMSQEDKEKIFSLSCKYKEIDEYYEKAKKRMIRRHKKELEDLRLKHIRDTSALTRSL